MKLAIVRIANRGVGSKERLHLSVLSDTNLSYYVVLASTRQANSVTAGWRPAFWFSPQPVKAGDTVILYSAAGVDTQEKQPNGTTCHFIHWGSGSTFWNKTGDCAVLLEVNIWQTSAYE
jgi:hypothetical protein